MVSVKIIKFLDKYFGVLICLVLSLFNFKSNITSYKRILLIQLWGLGETILCLPTIKELRKNKKNANIEILVTNRVNEVFYNNKNLNNIRVINLNPFSLIWFIFTNLRKYDLVIDMEEYLNISALMAFFTGKFRIGYNRGIRSKLYSSTVKYNDQQHVSQTFMDLLKPLGIKKQVKNIEKLNYSSQDKNNIDNLLKNNNIGKDDFIVGLGVGTAESSKSRMWPAERFAKLADHLIKKYNAKIIFVGNYEENNLINYIINFIKNKEKCVNAAGKTNVREMFYLISLCRLFIGNDSGPMHIAAAQRVKTIGLFGCNLPVRFKPFGKNNFSIRKQTGSPCINVHKGQVGECKHGIENACVKKIQVDDLTNLVNKILKKWK